MEKGWSLLEIILYTGLMAIVVPLIAVLVVTTTNTAVKERELNHLTAEGQRVVQIISERIGYATGVNQPSWGESGPILSLVINADISKDPTVFRLTNGTITIQEGGGPETALTSDQLTVTELTFFNQSQPGTEGVIRAEFILATPHLSKKFYASKSLQTRP